MRKLLLSLFSFLILSINSQASHLYGGEITISHIAGFSYELKTILYVDHVGIPPPGSIFVKSYAKSNNALMDTWLLPSISMDTIPQLGSNCLGTFNYSSGIITYADTILLDSGYGNPAGYLFAYTNCCMSANVINIANAGSNSITIVLDFPAVQQVGGQFINNSPVWSPIFPDVACSGIQKTLTNQAYDPDGDSLAYEFYAPFNGFAPSGGTFSSVSFAPGYSTSSPLVTIGLDGATGDLTMNPTTNGAHAFGVKASEYRNGNLIGVSYRQYHMVVVTCNQNSAPSSALAGIDPPGSTISGNNLTFVGGPAEIDFQAWDANWSSQNPESLSFSANITGWGSGTSNLAILNQPLVSATDTVLNTLTFLPDSLTSNVISVDIITQDDGCGDLTDTLHYDVTFVGYPSAGISGNTTVNVVNTGTTVDLFSHLGGNPDPGGSWSDDNNTGGLSGGILTTDNIPNGTYRYTYTVTSSSYPSVNSHVDVTINNTLLGLFGTKAHGQLKVFPNPSSGTFNILIPESADPEFAWVFDMMGRKVFDCPVSKDIHELDLSALAKGVYRLQIGGKENYQTTLIIE